MLILVLFENFLRFQVTRLSITLLNFPNCHGAVITFPTANIAIICDTNILSHEKFVNLRLQLYVKAK